MKQFKEVNIDDQARRRDSRVASVDSLVAELETNGVVVLPSLVSPDQLHDMQAAFGARLQRLRWNNSEGYQRTELYRHMVEDVLLLAQGFVDVAVHPLVKAIIDRYLGSTYRLTEAKGWKSLPTKRDFHGWHGDMWYDKQKTAKIHREIKLAMYLTNVRSGAFNFIKGSHQKQLPHNLKRDEVKRLDFSKLVELKGPAGTAFLFDTSIIHRQGLPMLEPRQAIFYAYHDPSIPLQEEDVDYYRYHPLLLNAAFLGDLSGDDRRVLGFGDKTNLQTAFVRPGSPGLFHSFLRAALAVSLRVQNVREHLAARWQKSPSNY